MPEADLSSILNLDGLDDVDHKPTLTPEQLKKNNEQGWGGDRKKPAGSEGQGGDTPKQTAPVSSNFPAPPVENITETDSVESPDEQVAPTTPVVQRKSKKKRKRRTTAFTGPNMTVRTRPGVKEILEDVAYEVDITTQELFEQMLIAYCDRKKLSAASAQMKKCGVSFK